jgi:hypothetical protein
MPCQARNRGGRPRGGEGVENGEGRLQRCDQDGPIQIAICCQHSSEFSCCKQGATYPIAKVLQSDTGANAVMGSKIVLAERCSEVEGSNRMMLP